MRPLVLLILAVQARHSFAAPALSTAVAHTPTATISIPVSSSASRPSVALTETVDAPASSGIPSSIVGASLPTATVTVDLDNATVVGVTDGTANWFLGLPFAQPPVDDLRFEPPQANSPYQGILNATYWGNQCINTLEVNTPSWITPAMEDYFTTLTHLANAPYDEDCLNLNVILPASVTEGAMLPVVAYIFFGAFLFGDSADVDGSTIVKRSIDMGQPVIFVSMNHRILVLTMKVAYGFLSGKEVMDAKAGNVGLQDQREALRWIQKYIPAFGGDPKRVTLLGFSSGAVSAGLQMVANGGDTEGLFHGVWTESGAIQSAGWLDQPPAQKAYDDFVTGFNCSSAADTFACIKKAPTDAVTKYGMAYPHWQPHTDGVFIRSPPQQALVSGNVSRIPIVAGNAEDEGTSFTLGFPDLSTTADVEAMIRTGYYPNITDEDMDHLLRLYPDDPSQGAPYNTGKDFQITPQWKRAASFLGDVGVVSVRKFFTKHLAALNSPVWAYYYKRNSIPGLGSTHGSELANMYGPGDMTDFLVNFVNRFDPNKNVTSLIHWEKYRTGDPVLLDFYGNDSLRLTSDTYREEALNLVMKLSLEQPLPF
ncbi:alpha/beta-hydrolase [Dichomitus squalens]|uniref:Carboxylic ester hydrolase n=1 Tax=Dichomitus squalens TaxID=114155 RepID=A0A4Q9MRH9_9APHY|nr:alpha/beta-hydrolase [Dichomitus squalens]